MLCLQSPLTVHFKVSVLALALGEGRLFIAGGLALNDFDVGAGFVRSQDLFRCWFGF